MKEAAGTVLYRQQAGKIEVLLVHPSGNYNKKASWSIPKGSPEPSESLEEAARRETLEETGVVAGKLVSLGYVEYTKSKKRVHGFAGEAPHDAKPSCASWEVDESKFVAIDKAKQLIHPDQAKLLDRLADFLAG
jgi:predicted NUDIX family NTP pyrophosphohydrolase